VGNHTWDARETYGGANLKMLNMWKKNNSKEKIIGVRKEIREGGKRWKER